MVMRRERRTCDRFSLHFWIRSRDRAARYVVVLGRPGAISDGQGAHIPTIHERGIARGRYGSEEAKEAEKAEQGKWTTPTLWSAPYLI